MKSKESCVFSVIVSVSFSNMLLSQFLNVFCNRNFSTIFITQTVPDLNRDIRNSDFINVFCL